MTRYDPKVIYKFATRLYSRAQLLVLVYTIVGVLIGGSFGAAYNAVIALASSFSNRSVLGSLGTSILGQSAAPVGLAPTNWMLIGSLVAGLIGFWIGCNKALALKLQAQAALCQAKIEENTNTARNGRRE